MEPFHVVGVWRRTELSAPQAKCCDCPWEGAYVTDQASAWADALMHGSTP